MMSDEHLAKEAQRLLHDETLLYAISEAQREAKDALVTVDVSNTIEILRLQANVQAYDGILSALESYVLRMATPGTGPVA